jgi:hypothetical protein
MLLAVGRGQDATAHFLYQEGNILADRFPCDDEAGDYGSFLPVIEGAVSIGVEGQAVQSGPYRLDARHTGNKGVAHCNWLHERSLACYHFYGLPDQVGYPFQRGEHCRLYTQPSNHDVCYRHSALAVLTYVNARHSAPRFARAAS